MLLGFELMDLVQEITRHSCQKGSQKELPTGISRDRHKENTQCGDKGYPSRPAKGTTYALIEENIACPVQ